MTSCTRDKTQNGIQSVQVRMRWHLRITHKQAYQRLKIPHSENPNLCHLCLERQVLPFLDHRITAPPPQPQRQQCIHQSLSSFIII